MSVEEVGCCGAYCGTCKALRGGHCRGCKLGYDTGDRDLSRARCKVKVCCMTKGHNSCADCNEYDSCDTIQTIHQKNGYKYGKYRDAIAFIRANGYAKFLSIADRWKHAYGRYN